MLTNVSRGSVPPVAEYPTGPATVFLVALIIKIRLNVGKSRLSVSPEYRIGTSVTEFLTGPETIFVVALATEMHRAVDKYWLTY